MDGADHPNVNKGVSEAQGIEPPSNIGEVNEVELGEREREKYLI